MSPRIQLAARRKTLGFSQESLAHAMDVTTSTMARWEQGTSTPHARHRRPLAEKLEITPVELDRLLDVEGQEIVGLDGHVVPDWLGHYASLEQGASELRTFEPIVIPALLQTVGYARAVERAYHLPVTEDEVRRRADIRLARQGVLGRQPDPLQLYCVIDEAVLRRVIGGTDIMAEQLGHLVDTAACPNAEIRVIPLEGSDYGGVFGAFQLLTSPGSTSPYITCSEDLTGKRYHDSPNVVASHGALFRHLSGVALDPTSSLDLIKTTSESSYR